MTAKDFDFQKPNYHDPVYQFNNFYDIESIPNVYTVAIFYPYLNRADLFYSIKNHSILDKQLIAKRVREVNPEMKDTTIYFYDLDTYLGTLMFTLRFQLGPRYGYDRLEHKVYGTHRTVIQDPATKKLITNKDLKFYPINDIALDCWLTSASKNSDEPEKIRQNLMLNHRQKLAKRLTDFTNNPHYFDNFSYENFWGFNSRNYDLTIISSVYAGLADVDKFYQELDYAFNALMCGKSLQPPYADTLYRQGTACDTAYTTTAQLFSDQYKDHMVSYVFDNPDVAAIYNNLHYSNRFCDITDNTGQQVSLKNRASALGRTIKESDILGTGQNINTSTELAELVAYNFCDVLNTTVCYAHQMIQSSLNSKKTTIGMFPVTMFREVKDLRSDQRPTLDDKLAHLCDIDSRRLTLDDTSASYATRVIAPYEALNDHYAIDLTFPRTTLNKEDELKARKYSSKVRAWQRRNHDLLVQYTKTPTEQIKDQGGLTVSDLSTQPEDLGYDVLDDTLRWFDQQEKKYPGSNLKEAFRPIYQAFNELRGHNINESQHQHDDVLAKLDKTIPDAPNTEKWIEKHRRDLVYYYRDEHGKPINAYATLRLGGIHGAEYNKLQYEVNLMMHQHRDELRASLIEQMKPLAEKYGSKKAVYQANPEFSLKPYINQPVKASYLFNRSGNFKLDNKKFENPNLTDIMFDTKGKLHDQYKFTSDNVSRPKRLNVFHADFSSFYPTLLTLMDVYTTWQTYKGKKLKINRYEQVYTTRLRIKKAWKTGVALDGSKLTPQLSAQYEDDSNSYKLILNSASGRSDEKRPNNIQMNNNTVSMRLIGQLFALRIGQALALHGARVPSTNTDGLYIYTDPDDPNPDHVKTRKDVQRVIDETVGHMFIKVDADQLDRFVSKDTNNRIEYGTDDNGNFANVIEDARGTDMTTYRGNRVDKKSTKPPLLDQILAEYFKTTDDLHNNLNHDAAKKILKDMFDKAQATDKQNGDTKQRRELLNRLAWTVRGNVYRYTYLNYFQPIYQFFDFEVDGKTLSKKDRTLLNRFKPVLDENGEPKIQTLQRINRLFLMKFPTDGSSFKTLNMVSKNTAAFKDKDIRHRSVQPGNMYENFAYNVIERSLNDPNRFAKDTQEWQNMDKNPYFKVTKYPGMPSPTFERPSELKRIGLDYERINVNEDPNHQDLKQVLQQGIEKNLDTINPYWTQSFSNQPVEIVNQNFAELSSEELDRLIDNLDYDAYIEILNDTYRTWQN